MQTPTPLEELLDLAADALGRDRRTLHAAAAGSPFVTLGGGLGQAMRLQGRAGERLGLALDLSGLMGPAPLADVLARALPVPPAPRPLPLPEPSAAQDLLPSQLAALTAQPYTGAAAVHRMLSAELAGPLDMAALRTALSALGARHEGLRTAFASSARGPVRRVLDDWTVPLMSTPQAYEGEEAVSAVQSRIAADVDRLVGHPGRPPLAFVLTRLAADRHLLAFLYHDAVADAWSAALVWRELLADYARAVRRRPLDLAPAPGPDAVAARAAALDRSGALRALTAERVGRLREFPEVVDLAAPARRPAVFDFRGERLLFGLDARLRDAVDATAARAGVPHTAVVLGAWALAVGRRAGREWLLVGAEMPRRPTAALLRTVAPCTVRVPVCCELEGGTDYFLRGIACAFSEGLRYADLDPAALARELGVRGDRSRTALTQVAFAAHDELLPARLEAGPLTARFHHGHLGGATADAELAVLGWREEPLLSLEFASSVLTRAEAAGLAQEVAAALEALAAAGPAAAVEDLLPAPLDLVPLAPVPVS
ncbi:condensation domain-containing protein [Streptomyces sp. NPDC044571]|uniref:condensation domain-containing protein n=1 Tax=Streptomyces sp. NPDC044571 TaxID=3155371 RepID=UPI0033E694C9